MLHHVIVKYNSLVKDKKAMNEEATALFSGMVGTVEGVRSVESFENCMNIENRYDLMIRVDMEDDALDAYASSAIHEKWIGEYGKFLEKKAIFDCKN